MTAERFDRLAERHRKVLRLYAQRYRLKEIGRALSLSENSVNTYLTEAVQILDAAGRRAAADALTLHEGPSRLSGYQSSAPDGTLRDAQSVDVQPVEASGVQARQLLPLRPRNGAPNGIPVYLRAFWIMALLIALIVGVAIAVALYSVYVKPMEHLLH